MKELWNKEQEIRFFTWARKKAKVEQLFYVAKDGKYYAYWPKDYTGRRTTLQARNAFIGDFTEAWSSDLLKDFAQSKECHVIRKVECNEIGLSKRSPADLAICRTAGINQKPEDIILIIEVKMSIVWNWELKTKNGQEILDCLGDYKTHKGNPGLLRSDTMLKAIGKSLAVKVSSPKASRIPIVILGNTPITRFHYRNVDNLKKNGIIQGFWSVNPAPLDNNKGNIECTKGLGFQRFDTYDELIRKTNELLQEEREFFSGMRTRKELGEIIGIANQEASYEKKAQRFLDLLKE